MKIKIEIDGSLADDEITILCSELNENIKHIQSAISSTVSQAQNFVLYKDETEFYMPTGEILFFESNANKITAHTINDIYTVKYKLYELEDILPNSFMRISKSAIINTDKIFSINKSLTSASLVSFKNTHKQIYISRYYYKGLKDKLREKRI